MAIKIPPRPNVNNIIKRAIDKFTAENPSAEIIKIRRDFRVVFIVFREFNPGYRGLKISTFGSDFSAYGCEREWAYVEEELL